jgi:hypothetical protein
LAVDDIELLQLAERWDTFCIQYVQMRGLDPEVVYTLHASDDTGPQAITVEDLTAAAAGVRRLVERTQRAEAAAEAAAALRAAAWDGNSVRQGAALMAVDDALKAWRVVSGTEGQPA